MQFNALLFTIVLPVNTFITSVDKLLQQNSFTVQKFFNIFK